METRKTALVVYESMFGNTREIAEAIADGLSGHLEVELRDVASMPAPGPRGHDLVVAGGPTHAFSLSRPSTRSDAVKQGATGSAATGLREWLGTLPAAIPTQLFATFDTRVEAVRHFPGSGAKKAARFAHAAGYTVIDRETFRVLGTPGPLVSGETSRARTWGHRLGAAVLDRAQEPAG